MVFFVDKNMQSFYSLLKKFFSVKINTSWSETRAEKKEH